MRWEKDGVGILGGQAFVDAAVFGLVFPVPEMEALLRHQRILRSGTYPWPLKTCTINATGPATNAVGFGVRQTLGLDCLEVQLKGRVHCVWR
jgi:hypothetical protein